MMSARHRAMTAPTSSRVSPDAAEPSRKVCSQCSCRLAGGRRTVEGAHLPQTQQRQCAQPEQPAEQQWLVGPWPHSRQAQASPQSSVNSIGRREPAYSRRRPFDLCRMGVAKRSARWPGEALQRENRVHVQRSSLFFFDRRRASIPSGGRLPAGWPGMACRTRPANGLPHRARAPRMPRCTMTSPYLLNSLNDAQREAVAAPLGHLLVLAGAGTGKTRVLVHRIAWLIQVEGAAPHSILAVTFTNKAAARDARPHRAVARHQPGRHCGSAPSTASPTACCARTGSDAGLPQNFQILDSDDQQRLIKRIMRELDLDEARGRRARCSGSSTARRTRGGARAQLRRGRRPVPDHAPARLPRPTRTPASGAAGRLRRTAAARARAVARPSRICSPTTSGASATCWSTSSRTPTPIQYAWLRCWPARGGNLIVGRRRRPVDLRLARRADREHPAVPPTTSPTCAGDPPGAELPLHRHHPARPPTRSSPTTASASARSCGPQAHEGEPIRALRRLQRASTRRASSSSGSRSRSTHGGTPQRGRDPLPLQRPVARARRGADARAACPIASTAACASSSAPRSRTPWPTCAWSRTAIRCGASSASSTRRRAASARRPSRRSASCARSDDTVAVAGRTDAPRRKPAAPAVPPARVNAFLNADRRLAAASRASPLHALDRARASSSSGPARLSSPEKGRARRSARMENLEELVSPPRAAVRDRRRQAQSPLAAFLDHAALEAGEPRPSRRGRACS